MVDAVGNIGSSSVYYSTYEPQRKIPGKGMNGACVWVGEFEDVREIFDAVTASPPAGREGHRIRTISFMIHTGPDVMSECEWKRGIHRDDNVVGSSFDIYAVKGADYLVHLYKGKKHSRKPGKELLPLHVSSGCFYSVTGKYRTDHWHALQWAGIKYTYRIGYW